MSKTAKGQSAADTLNLMKEGFGLTKMQKQKLKKFLLEEAEDIGMTSRHPNKKETKRSIGPAGASIVSDDGKRIKSKAKGGMIKGYMGGGEVHMDDSPNSGMITTKGFGASRKT
jgi:hypothetical protein